MDFGKGAEGSASAIMKAVSSFIGAGVTNRIVAIADNDTAAHDAMKKMKASELPANVRLLHYPSLGFLASYPSLGPQSFEAVLMDVNGLAGSLELYLGTQVLAKLDGALRPV